MNTSREKTSYCIGLEAGKSLMRQFGELDLAPLLMGFEHAIYNKPMQLSEEEIKQTVGNLRNAMEMQQRKVIAQIAEENKRAGEAFLEENKTKEGIHTLSSGLQYKVLASGEGPRPTTTDVVTVHCKATTLDGKVLDSTYERKNPNVLPVSQSIPAWSQALQLMKVGDRWQVFSPSYLAYGEAGFGPHIAPNMTLIFELELVAIN